MIEPHHDKTCLCHMRITNTQVSCSLFSGFVICCLDFILPIVAISETLRHLLAFVAEQTNI